MRALISASILLFSGCHAVPATAVYAGLGFGAGVLRLDAALVELMTAGEARPPNCGASVPRPCVLLPTRLREEP